MVPVSDDHDLVQEAAKSSRLEGGVERESPCRGGEGACRGGRTKLLARLPTPRLSPHLLRQQVLGLLGVPLGQGLPQLSTGTCDQRLGVISRTHGLGVG